MLHSRSQRQNLNQENPTAARPLHPTKTPLRQQQQSAPLKGLLTSGKGLIGVKTPGRVGGILAQRDGNQGKGTGKCFRDPWTGCQLAVNGESRCGVPH